MSEHLTGLLMQIDLAAASSDDEADYLATELREVAAGEIYPRSFAAAGGAVYFLSRADDRKMVGAVTAEGAPPPFEGETRPVTLEGVTYAVTLASRSPELAAQLRSALPFLAPRPLGLQTSAGCGDRLGLATPGHIQGLRATFGHGRDEVITIAPIFAQQSIRENARTGRTPQEVLDDAMWGVFQEGWRQGYGADADHLMTLEDAESCVEAGYTFYTVDPGNYVDDRANTASPAELQVMLDTVPWDVLDDTENELVQRLTDAPIDLGAFEVQLDPVEIVRAAAKYGHAVAHTLIMYQHIESMTGNFEFEMSVDETETVTTLAEHIYIASELQRLGVHCVSLAPRYVGSFEKGVDYVGDIDAFEESFRKHHAVALAYGPYKLSLHSGSDKFRVYPVAHSVAGDLVHLKTAGTSYLEAVRAIADIDPALFRAIVAFARERYPEDRATYHVSAELSKMPVIDDWPDAELPTLLENFHAREVLHVTFGSVLNNNEFRQPFFEALRANETVYDAVLARHFQKHFAPFM
jgi:hypothetical protein